MSKVYSDPVQVRRKDDGSFTLSVRLNDGTVLVTAHARPAMERLYQELMKLLGEKSGG